MKIARLHLLSGFLVLLIIAGGITPLLAQDDVILTLTVPVMARDAFSDALFSEFEAAHPGVQVVLSEVGSEPFYTSAANDLDEHLTSAEAYVASGDVVYVSSANLSPFSTRAGYFLNLAPLIETDPTFNVDDFFPAAWESVQWDRGVWGIPVSAYTVVVLYDVDAFDEAGLTYPDETWTLDQYIQAGRELTRKNAAGAVEVPGIWIPDPAYFARALLGEGFYDPTILPNPPYFGNPDLIPLLETWLDFQEEITPAGEVDYMEVPLALGTPQRIVFGGMLDSGTWAAALLPGGVAGLEIQGFAVSAGTQYPEQAYELVKFLSASPAVVTRLFGDTPARQSLLGQKNEDDIYAFIEADDEVQAIIDEAVAHAFPVSELRFADFLDNAIQKVKNDQVDVQLALQEAETEALAALDTAEQRGAEAIIAVATPVPPPQVGEGETVLEFGMTLFGTNLANRDEWNQVMDEFVANHPQVGSIDFKAQIFLPADLAELDCYYYPVNSVPTAKLDTLISLDPFLDADPLFDPNDILGDTMQQLQRDNRTWAYPIDLQPMVLLYDYERFLRDGVLEPDGDWSIEAFNDALEILRSTSEEGSVPFVPQSYGNQYLLMLAAAYGGVPYDYSTNPPTIHFTDPVNLDAIRQVLDLAKEDYLDYRELANLAGGFLGGQSEDVPILGETLSSMSLSYLLGEEEEEGAIARRIVNYPHGSLYVPVSYDIGSAYITTNAENPQACYDWISTMAQHPELFAGISPLRSMLTDPAVIASQGEDMTAFYNAFVALLDDPNRMIFPGVFGGQGEVGPYIEQMWLNEAFDNYVLHDGDLEADLADAEMYIDAFRECTADLPLVGEANYRTQLEGMAYVRQFTDCAIDIDPDQKDTYAIYYLGVED